MDQVIGSKQYRSVVVQDRSGRRLLVVAGVVVLLVVVAMLAYWLGGELTRSNYQALTAAHEKVVQQLAIAEAKYQQASQQLANSSLGAEVDRQAVENVRAVVREHKQTITQLNEEISFYKGLMAPTERERGLSIRSWEVYPAGDARRFQFKLVVQQLAVKHTVLKGAVTVQLVGRQGDIEQTFPLSILSEQVEEETTKLRFKYFQYLEGELQLPDGFAVERVDIVAKASAPKTVQVEKHYSWIVNPL